MPSREQIVSSVLRNFIHANPGLSPFDPQYQPHIQGDIGAELQQEEQFQDAFSHYSAMLPPTPSPTLAHNFRSSFAQGSDGSLSLAYGISRLGDGASQAYATQNRGVFLTPEQQGQANLGMAPGTGAVVGGIGGAFFGQPVLGAGIGAAIGSGVQAVGGAALEREQSTRLTAESLASVLGSATDSIQKFKAAIDATGVPVQQLAAGLSTLASGAPGITSASVTSAGRAATALGAFYEADTKQIGAYLSENPITFRAREAYTRDQGGLSNANYQGIATNALFEGDIDTYNTARRDAARTANPEASRLQQELSSGMGRYAYNFRHYWASDFGGKASSADATLDWANKTLNGAASSDDSVKLSDTVMGWRGSIAFGETQLGKAQTSLTVAMLRGESPSAIAGIVNNNISTATSTLTTADRGIISAIQGQIPTLEADLKNAKTPTERAVASSSLSKAYDTLNQYQGQENQGDISYEQGRRTSTQFGIETTTAEFDRSIVQSTLGGKTYGQMGESVRDQAKYLRGQSSNIFADLTPSERERMRNEADTLVYNNRLQGYGQTEAGIGVSIAQAGTGVAGAQATGDPSSVYKALNEQLDRQVQLQSQLSEELRKGNLTKDDEIAKTRQLAEVSSQIVSGRAAAIYGQTVSTEAIQGAGITGAESLNPRALRLGGDRAFSTSLLGDLDTAYNFALKASTDSPNANERADQKLRADQLLADLQNQRDLARSYIPSAAVSTRLSTDTANYNIAGNLPFIGGLGSNPYTQGGAVIRDLTGQIDAATAKFQSLANPTDIDRQNYANTVNPMREQRSEMERIRMTAAEMSLVTMHEGEGPATRAAESGAPARAAMFSPNSWLSGTWDQVRPDNSYGYSPRGGNIPQAFMDMAHNAGKSANADVVDAINRLAASILGRATPMQPQKNSAVSAVGTAIRTRSANVYGTGQ